MRLYCAFLINLIDRKSKIIKKMGMNEIMSEGVEKKVHGGKNKKKKYESSDEGKKKEKVIIICCTIM